MFTFPISPSFVFCILVLELIGEVFIRPDGYRRLMFTEKAFSPQVIRGINNFHLVVEIISLIFFIPEFICLFGDEACRQQFSLSNASQWGVIGPDRIHAFYGRAFYAIVRLRMFGMVRHWKQTWINATILEPDLSRQGTGLIKGGLVPNIAGRPAGQNVADDMFLDSSKTRIGGKMNKIAPVSDGSEAKKSAKRVSSRDMRRRKAAEKKEDKFLTNATNIGTALMVINSHRALILTAAIAGLIPLFTVFQMNGGVNDLSTKMTRQMLGTNVIANQSSVEEGCAFLKSSALSWLSGTTGMKGNITDDSISIMYVLSLQILPVRCPFQGLDGFVTREFCKDGELNSTAAWTGGLGLGCEVWMAGNTSDADLAKLAGIREGAIETCSETYPENGNFSVTAKFNQAHTIKLANFASLLLQAVLFVFVLLGLSILRLDAGRLVLGPLRKMLTIVNRYAKNPLATSKQRGGRSGSGRRNDSYDGSDASDSESGDPTSTDDELGNFETEQLITVVTKITDLLRQCWGIAGAGIVSSNLARREDGLATAFNPTVPGRMVYGLFGFAAVKGWDHILRSLGEDIMILVNDVAAVLHGEVYRWGFGDSGQCNKNLGAAFLMVYRIGDIKEVKEKRDKATNVIFNTASSEKERLKSGAGMRRRRNRNVAKSSTGSMYPRDRSSVDDHRAENVSLASLPGINAFTDRAVLGMLKTYAGIARNGKLLNWREDFRLGAGVGAFAVDMIFGMDAGWAVEGAVGSELKIDATYLSPHVNMSSRMMSACKQYGVPILLSQAVEELLSDQARAVTRHLDTITVKGSSVKQKIFTYDARIKNGADFSLLERTKEEADLDADRYSPIVWATDRDLRAMRQHISKEFLISFNKGRDAYLAGNWNVAVEHLEKADEIMVNTIIEQGFMEKELDALRYLNPEDAAAEEEHLRDEMGDGPSRRLLAFIRSLDCVPPKDWEGYRPLMSK